MCLHPGISADVPGIYALSGVQWTFIGGKVIEGALVI